MKNTLTILTVMMLSHVHRQLHHIKELSPQCKDVKRVNTSKGLNKSYNNAVEDRKEKPLEIEATKHHIR